MADKESKQSAQGLKEKLESLKSLITSLHEQTRELQHKTASRAERQKKKSSVSVPSSTLHQNQFQTIEKRLSNRTVQGKEQIGSTLTHSGHAESKVSDIKRNGKLVKENSSMVSTSVSQSVEQNEISGTNGENSEIPIETDQTRVSVNSQLSRLAKEVWNKKAEKISKRKYNNFGLSQESKDIRRPAKELYMKNHVNGLSNIYKLNNVQSHLLKKPLSKTPTSLLDINYPRHQGSSENSQSIESRSTKKVKQNSASKLIKNSKCTYSNCDIQSNEIQSQVFDVAKSSSNLGGLSGNDAENDGFETANALTASSDRLSALAKETWKSTVVAKSVSHRHLKGWNKSKQRTAGSLRHNEIHKRFTHSSGQSLFLKELSGIRPSDKKISTDDHLSNLAKNIWQKQMILLPYGNRNPSSRSRPLKYQMKPSKSPIIFPASKFNWISKEKNATSFLYRRKRAILKKSRFKIVRGNSAAKSSSNQSRMKRSKSKSKESKVLFTNPHGKKFVTDTKGRHLIRLSLSSSSNSPSVQKLNEGLQRNAMLLPARRRSLVYLTPSRYKMVRRLSLNQSASTKIVKANRMVKKSLYRIHRQNTRKIFQKQNQYCMFFNRFGKCKNGAKCRYVHDPEKVAVCTRFLRGTCKDSNCLFSHKIDRQKMPTCLFFLNGACHRENCPYSHVKVSGTAEICKEFLKGYCPSGDKCLKRHVLECAEYSMRGSCPDGDKCKLYHRKRKIKRRRSSSLSGTKTPRPFAKKVKLRRSSDEISNFRKSAEDDLKIRPSFTSMENPKWGIVDMTRLKRKRRFDWKRETEDT